MFHSGKYDYDLIVLGSGPGGSVGAHYAKALGKKVAVFEAEAIGGKSPHYTSLPTNTYLTAVAMFDRAKQLSEHKVLPSVGPLAITNVSAWKRQVVARSELTHGKEAYQREGIHIFHAKARFLSPHTIEAGGKVYSAAKFLIATGAKPLIPAIVGLEEVGYSTYKDILADDTLPKSVAIIGAGQAGCEYAYLLAGLGCSVTLISRSVRVLSSEDEEVSEIVTAMVQKKGVRILTKTNVTNIQQQEKKVLSLSHDENESSVTVDAVMLAVGVVPNLDFSPEKAGINILGTRMIINNYLQTTAPHIVAAGDVIGPFNTSHEAYYQSHLAVHNVFSRHKRRPEYTSIPRCLFTYPQIAAVGMTEEDARKGGIRIKKGIAALAVVGRALIDNEREGFVKVITNRKGIIIGAVIVAPTATEMIHELALAVKLRLKATDLAEMVHAYPTFSETIKIACSLVR